MNTQQRLWTESGLMKIMLDIGKFFMPKTPITITNYDFERLSPNSDAINLKDNYSHKTAFYNRRIQ